MIVLHASVLAPLLEYLSRTTRIAPKGTADALLAVRLFRADFARGGREYRVVWGKALALQILVPFQEVAARLLPSYRKERSDDAL